MADVLVLKIKYDETLRRITVPRSPEPSFASLDKKIRELFNLPQKSSFVVTYTDNEGDVVTMADDDDLKDAVTFQSLNPLRLKVELLNSTSSPVESSAASGRGGKKPADPPIPEQVDPTVAPKVPKDSDGGHKLPVNMKKIQEVLEEKLKATFGVDAEVLSAAFQPFLSVAPRALDEVIDAANKSGFIASFEPNFCTSATKSENKSPGEAHESNSSSVKSAVPDEASGEQTDRLCVPKEGDDSGAIAAETASERVFHSGVQCDMCGMTPIVGPRYKSNVKADYDLCRSCFEQHGVAGDYNKIERGLYRPRQFPFWAHAGRPGFNGHPFGPGPRVCYGGRPFHMGRGGGCGRSFDRCPEGKLDSRFVKDVTIFDGTEFAPGTLFTKIWRLRNTGAIPWPQHTRLVHVGGDNFGADDFVTVPLPEEGLQPGEEVEASVDLIAPSTAGRYVSHYRLMAPGGRKFGHRVWALIQVVPSDEPSPQVAESFADVPSNSEAGPSTSSVDSEKSVIQTDSAPKLPEGMDAENSAIEQTPSVEDVVSVVEEVSSVDDTTAQKDIPSEVHENIVHIPVVVDTPTVAEPELPSEEKTSVGGFSFVDHPAVETIVVNVGESSNAYPVEAEVTDIDVDVENNSGEEGTEFVNVESGNGQCEELLQQLEAMGFSDQELNKELLNQYNMDFARVLDDLVAATEWDPMLEELEEMGFYDTKANRRLMFKNKGSVKRVVKELVQMYKQQGEKA